MASIRRFFYVTAPEGAVRHIQLGTTHSAGRVVCGRSSDKGWLWNRVDKDTRSRPPRCKACVRGLAGMAIAAVAERERRAA
jgi:hypothetical protein